MSPWICPNTGCPYNKQLRPGQRCPSCRQEAKDLSFSEFSLLSKEKETLQKAIARAKEQRQALERMKFCPKCGSIHLNFLVYFRPSIWRCLDCGYEGAFIVEGGELAEKIREENLKAREETRE